MRPVKNACLSTFLALCGSSKRRLQPFPDFCNSHDRLHERQYSLWSVSFLGDETRTPFPPRPDASGPMRSCFRPNNATVCPQHTPQERCPPPQPGRRSTALGVGGGRNNGYRGLSSLRTPRRCRHKLRSVYLAVCPIEKLKQVVRAAARYFIPTSNG
jgi:hypothetical protein